MVTGEGGTFTSGIEELKASMSLMKKWDTRKAIYHLFHDNTYLKRLEEELERGDHDGNPAAIAKIFDKYKKEEKEFHRDMIFLMAQVTLLLKGHRELYVKWDQDVAHIAKEGYSPQALQEVLAELSKDSGEFTYKFEALLRAMLSEIHQADAGRHKK